MKFIICVDCGKDANGTERCHTCGAILCLRCFEDGMGFCSDDQDETYDPSETMIPIEEDYVPSLELEQI